MFFKILRYSVDYGMFRFCIADSEHDWREGTEQYKFIEHCLASVDRQKQPWLIFAAHRVLGYSSDFYYGLEGSFEEPMGRESLQKLWQRYKVDIAFYGHVHNYERSCPIYQVCHIHVGQENFMLFCFSGALQYRARGASLWLSFLAFFVLYIQLISLQISWLRSFLYYGHLFICLLIFWVLSSVTVQSQCVSSEKSHYSGTFNATIHVVAGGGGSHLSNFSQVNTKWSLYRDYDFGFVKLTAFNHSSLLFEYKKSRDGNVYDSFSISRDYRDILACVHDSCEASTLAS